MPHISDEDDRGRLHPDRRTGRHRSRRERSRHHRANLETSDKEDDTSDSSVRSWSRTRHNELLAVPQHHHHQRSRSAWSPTRNSKSSVRGRSEIEHEPNRHLHTRDSHSAEPSGNSSYRRQCYRTRSRGAEERNRLHGRLAENALSTAAMVAFRLRNSEGSWVGKKGLKVVGAAAATTAICAVFDRNPKEHALRHIAVSMVEGAVRDAIAASSPVEG